MGVRGRLAALLAVVVVVAACGGGDGSAGDGGGGRLVLMTHDSFSVSEEVLDRFREETGVELEVLRGGDAGSMVNQAILTKDRPLADVLFGVDSTFLTRALDEDIFVAYESPELRHVPGELVLDPQHRVTPIDYGDVCLNYDTEWFAERELAPPASLDDLVDPSYRGLTVVQNPASSSPGLAFLLATVAEYGDGDGWQGYWRGLRVNDVEVVDGWEEAYFGSFTGGGGGGDRPVVVSYASSPPADVIYSDPPRDEPRIGVVEESCYRQVEFAGILRGTRQEEAARALVDFMLSETFQSDIPLQMFVFPARSGVELPEVFERFAARPQQPLELDVELITEHRDRWIREWTDTVLR